MLILRANGKLLLTGEYVILSGAAGIALPVRFGQSIKIRLSSEPRSAFSWKSYCEGRLWYTKSFSFDTLSGAKSDSDEVTLRLQKLLRICRKFNKEFLLNPHIEEVITELDYPAEWGLGSSSTLISLLSRWAQVNPYEVLAEYSGGSGYDIACASSFSPLLYRVTETGPESTHVNFKPDYSDRLFFVYSGRKQRSDKEVRAFDKTKVTKSHIREIDRINNTILGATGIEEFMQAVEEHEMILSGLLSRPALKQTFSDFPGVVKSLGAWGGDFFLAASTEEPDFIETYFRSRGHQTIFPFSNLVLNKTVKQYV